MSFFQDLLLALPTFAEKHIVFSCYSSQAAFSKSDGEVTSNFFFDPDAWLNFFNAGFFGDSALILGEGLSQIMFAPENSENSHL